MTITDQEFLHIASYIKKNYGINLSAKKVLITGRLQNYLTQHGYHSYKEYMDRVESDQTGTEARMLVNFLTTNHTYFMREPVHFNYLKNIVLPILVDQEKCNREIRIWSAASSTGEEPYSIVMVLQDYFRMLPEKWDTRILASDISTKALGKAIEGIYAQEQVEVLPERWRKIYFEPAGSSSYQVKEELRNEVIYRTVNLMEAFQFRKKFHVIFLRNVMIYFEAQTKKILLEKIYDILEDGGYLFIGTTETIDKTASNLKYIQPAIYQK